jgi:glycosyltransferase involved in cell wall biosynthesis
MRIAIDASRNRSGGAIVHIVNILKHFDDNRYDIEKIHLWSYDKLLIEIPDYPWLVKHSPSVLNENIARQLAWQYFNLSKEIKSNNCDLLLSVDGGSVCRFAPYITMSRDMLSFEKKEISRYFFSFPWLRLYLLKFVQLSSFKNSTATIFLTDYARNKISEYHNIDYETIIINHGIADNFRINKKNINNLTNEKEIILTYVSNADLYKHNWNVIEAVYNIRSKYGLNVQLQLIGSKDGNSKALNKINLAQEKFDSKNIFVIRTSKISHGVLVSYLEKSDIFIFASTCENMPNTLIEGMSTGLPIVCSSYGPMPEVVQDGAVFFDPENVNSIEDALYLMISDDELRLKCAKRSYEISKEFSWKKCSNETFKFLSNKIKNEIKHK